MTLDELKNMDIQDLIENLRDLDFENVGSWPSPVKILLAIILFVLVVAAGYFVTIKPALAKLERLQGKEESLIQEFEDKAFKAANIDEYKEQLQEMRASFGSMLQQLPKDTEVPGLLEDITHTGLGSGLEFEKISLGDEVEKKFYAVLPIHIKVRGNYHGFGSFVSGVASMPRIVTLHDFKISPVKNNGQPGGMLEMTITAKTYRYAGGPDGQSGGTEG